MGHVVYVAGPSFTEEQRQTMNELEELLDEMKISYFSPRQRCYCPPNASQIERNHSFQMNCTGVTVAEVVLARIDGYGAGTMFEIGHAYAARTPIVAFSTEPTTKINLMLACACRGFLSGIKEVKAFLKPYHSTNQFDWTSANRWRKEVI
mgnify:CR=1 FL=1